MIIYKGACACIKSKDSLHRLLLGDELVQVLDSDGLTKGANC